MFTIQHSSGEDACCSSSRPSGFACSSPALTSASTTCGGSICGGGRLAAVAAALPAFFLAGCFLPPPALYETYAPALGLALLLLVSVTGLPLWAFSALSSLVYALVVPLAAIAITLLYGDAAAAHISEDHSGTGEEVDATASEV